MSAAEAGTGRYSKILLTAIFRTSGGANVIFLFVFLCNRGQLLRFSTQAEIGWS